MNSTTHTPGTPVPNTTTLDQDQLAAQREATDASERDGAIKAMGAPPAALAPANALLRTLQNLDRYMAASGFEPGHPWRIEIANAVTADRLPTYGDTLDHVDNINAAACILEDLLDLALQECIRVEDAGHAESLVRAAIRYASDIVMGSYRLAGVPV